MGAPITCAVLHVCITHVHVRCVCLCLCVCVSESTCTVHVGVCVLCVCEVLHVVCLPSVFPTDEK